MILPWITLAAVQAAFYTRLSRGQLLGGVVVVASIIVDLVYALLDPGSGSPEAR